MRISDWSSDVCSFRSKSSACARNTDFPQTSSAAGFTPCTASLKRSRMRSYSGTATPAPISRLILEIGRATCRERLCQYVNISVVALLLKNKIKDTYTELINTHKKTTECRENKKK